MYSFNFQSILFLTIIYKIIELRKLIIFFKVKFKT